MSLRWPAARRGQATESAPARINSPGEFDLPADLRARPKKARMTSAIRRDRARPARPAGGQRPAVRPILQVDPVTGLEPELGRLRPAEYPASSPACLPAPMGLPSRVRLSPGPDRRTSWTGAGMFANTKAFSGFAVNDLESAKKFYGETLGLSTSEQYGLLTLHLAGGRDTLVYPKPDHVPPATRSSTSRWTTSTRPWTNCRAAACRWKGTTASGKTRTASTGPGGPTSPGSGTGGEHPGGAAGALAPSNAAVRAPGRENRRTRGWPTCRPARCTRASGLTGRRTRACGGPRGWSR